MLYNAHVHADGRDLDHVVGISSVGGNVFKNV